eukprot:scaffold28677_cov112-Isochrysis_galbana.AAC.5
MKTTVGRAEGTAPKGTAPKSRVIPCDRYSSSIASAATTYRWLTIAGCGINTDTNDSRVVATMGRLHTAGGHLAARAVAHPRHLAGWPLLPLLNGRSLRGAGISQAPGGKRPPRPRKVGR